MGIHQVSDMQIVADTGAVWRIKIRAKNGQSIPFPVDGIPNQRDQMCFWLVNFANHAIGISNTHPVSACFRSPE